MSHEQDRGGAGLQARALQRVQQARHGLLALHKAIVDVEKMAHERAHGRMSAGAFLQVLVTSETFAWLGPLTAVIVQLDELLDALEAENGTDDHEWVDEIRTLLDPQAKQGAFQRRYAELLQSSPDVALAHAAVLRVLRG